MSKLRNMRIVEIPPFRAVSSGEGTLGGIFGGDGFDQWCNTHKDLLRPSIYEPNDFLWHEDNDINRSVLIRPIKDEVADADTAPYKIIEFRGGMYLVATADESDERDINETIDEMFRWIDTSPVFMRGDYPISGMCNMPNPDGNADRLLGISQQQIFLPLRQR